MAPDTEAQKLRASVGKTVASMFKELGHVMPILHIVDDYGNHIPVHWATGFENYDIKDTTADTMKKVLRTAHAVRYAFVTEAWTLDHRTANKETCDSALAMVQRGETLEHHPDRIEVISIFVEDKHTKECLWREYRILRPEHGKPTLAPARDMDVKPEDHTGRFAHLFD